MTEAGRKIIKIDEREDGKIENKRENDNVLSNNRGLSGIGERDGMRGVFSRNEE